MSLMERWQTRRREIEAALAERGIDPEAAGRELAHLDHRIQRRPRIDKRRNDRKAWRAAQAAGKAAAFAQRQEQPAKDLTDVMR